MSVLDAAERLKQDVGALLEAGRTVAREYGSVGGSFRRLLLSDIALARTALMRGLVFLLLCALTVGTAWVIVMTMLVIGLRQAGLPWLLALLAPLLISLVVAWRAWVAAQKALVFADLDATRRQLAVWFPPSQPISTKSPTGETSPGPPDPTGPAEVVAPGAP